MHRFVIGRRKSMISTSSRVAIVTGGSGGIGRAAAERLGADGFAVVVNYPGNKIEADAVVEVIESKGARAITAPYTPPLDRVIVAEVSNWK
jgi:NAD(P)-dependent dehydrogenase (short-subunit alcohol dehydrogenase family)